MKKSRLCTVTPPSFTFTPLLKFTLGPNRNLSNTLLRKITPICAPGSQSMCTGSRATDTCGMCA